MIALATVLLLAADVVPSVAQVIRPAGFMIPERLSTMDAVRNTRGRWIKKTKPVWVETKTPLGAFRSTAYCKNCGGGPEGSLTKTGAQVGFGKVAVDPSVIKLGTKLKISGYGKALAADTGGAIHGKRIDLAFDRHI